MEIVVPEMKLFDQKHCNHAERGRDPDRKRRRVINERLNRLLSIAFKSIVFFLLILLTY
jgi:hypothetical protein